MTSLSDAWHGTLREIDDHIFWIRQHLQVLAAREERPEFLCYVRMRLEERKPAYLAAVRRLTEYEATEGYAFYRSPTYRGP